MNGLDKDILCNFSGCDEHRLGDLEFMELALSDVANACDSGPPTMWGTRLGGGALVIATFSCGYLFVVTKPEHRYAALTISLALNGFNAWEIPEDIAQRLAASHMELREIPRRSHAAANQVTRTYYTGRSEFQDICVVRSPDEGKLLILDGDTQSAQKDEKIYHETLVHAAMASAKRRSEVLVLGGGEGATLREVLRHPEVRRCTMVDIDSGVVNVAKALLPEWSAGAFDDARANLIIGDALAYVRETGNEFDVIVSDLSEPVEESLSSALFNDDVFADIKRRLSPGGIYVLQASSAGLNNMSLHAKISRTLKRHYKHVKSFVTLVPSFGTDWGFIACSDEVDVSCTQGSIIEQYCAELTGKNMFYDAETHERLFALPLYLRQELSKSGDVF